jgi:DNA-binding transcriptional ArsR family regulator
MQSDSEQYDRLFHALADASRRQLVERLSRGPASMKTLADGAGMGLPSALKHLRVLEEGGVVVSTKAGRTRTFQLQPDALSSITRWVEGREKALTAGFDRLAAAMAELPEEKP